MPKKRLGKGLEALITTHSTESSERFLVGAVSIDEIIHLICIEILPRLIVVWNNVVDGYSSIEVSLILFCRMGSNEGFKTFSQAFIRHFESTFQIQGSYSSAHL